MNKNPDTINTENQPNSLRRRFTPPRIEIDPQNPFLPDVSTPQEVKDKPKLPSCKSAKAIILKDQLDFEPISTPVKAAFRPMKWDEIIIEE